MSERNTNLPLILIGGGGHATVLAEILINTSKEVIAVVCPDTIDSNPVLSKFEHISSDGEVFRFPITGVKLVMGIGKMHGSELREHLIRKFSDAGYQFATVISPAAVVSKYVTIGSGVQILPGAIVNAATQLSDHVIINSGAIVEHDCYISENVHIAPGATVCGGVMIGKGTIVGPRAVVAQGCRVGRNSVIGAGCSVVRDVASSTKLIPNKPIIYSGDTN